MGQDDHHWLNPTVCLLSCEECAMQANNPTDGGLMISRWLPATCWQQWSRVTTCWSSVPYKGRAG